MSQTPKRSKPRAKSSAQRPVPTKTNRAKSIYTLIAVLVVISLVATLVGPPLIDYLTQPDEPETVSLDDEVDIVEQQFRDDIAANPGDAELIAGLGNYLANTGRVDEAIPWYEQALALAPDNPDIRLGFGRALALGDKRNDAELQYIKALELRPNDPQTLFSLAQLYASWVPARTEEAVAAYNQVIQYGGDAFIVERAKEELSELGFASPVASSPVAASPVGSPVP